MEEGGGELESVQENSAKEENNENGSANAAEKMSVEIDHNSSVPCPIEDNKDDDRKCDKTEKKNPEERLCGWLYQRSRGIRNLKAFKQRWYQFGDENCKLYCYRYAFQ